MENLLRGVAMREKSLDTDQILRYSKRPNVTNSLEDFGSSFSTPRDGTRRDAKTMKSTYLKPDMRGKVTPTRKCQETDDSDDELLLSSQPSTAGAETYSSQRSSSRTNKLKSQEKVAEKSSHSQPQGCQASKPHTSELVKMKVLKFNKIKNNHTTEPDTSIQESTNSFSSQPSLSQGPPNQAGVLRDCDYNTHSTDYGVESVAAGPPRKCAKVQSVINATPRPKPRPLKKTTNRRELPLEEIPFNSQVKPTYPEKIAAIDCSEHIIGARRRPSTDTNFTRRSTLTPVHPVVDTKAKHRDIKAKADLDCPTPSIKKPRIPYPTYQQTNHESSHESRSSVKKIQDFPLLYSQKLDGESKRSPAPHCKSAQKRLSPKPFPLSLTEEQGKGLPVVNCRSKREKLSQMPFPLSPPKEKEKAPSNNTSDTEKLDSEKPRLRPRKSKSGNAARKPGSARTYENDVKKSSLPAPQPFPLSTQVINGIGPGDIPSPSVLRNRASCGSSPERRKKRRSSFSVAASSHDDTRNTGCDWDEDFSVALSNDPKLLCPFCDALLPQPVSPFLRKLINNALKKSRHDPRPGNPLGRKAPSATFITVCQRHTFESEELPKAQANGWPKSIDWEQLGDRIRAMWDDLEVLLSGLRDRTVTSLLWKDVKQELQAKGSRAVASVREQFASFEKAQAGYYGELGYAIIHQSLLDLFPPTSCDLDFAEPLTPEQFIQRVLVPEVATRLIQEDLDLRGAGNMTKALKVLRDSSKYGVAMFPDDSNDNSMSLTDDDQLGVADMIVMKRARKRRQELEEEYQREQEEQSNEERKERKGCTKRKTDENDARSARKGPKMEEIEYDTEAENLKPRPRPLQKKCPTGQANRYSQGSTPEYSGYEGSEECLSNFPPTSQESFTPYEPYGSRSDSDICIEPDDEVLVPDSDEGESGAFFLARRAIECVPLPATMGRRRKKQRDLENEESTPKPTKLRRTIVPKLKAHNSQPLLLARQRARQPSGTEFVSIAKDVNSSRTSNDDNGIWVTSMIAPVDAVVSTLRKQWSLEFAWLLSDGSQE